MTFFIFFQLLITRISSLYAYVSWYALLVVLLPCQAIAIAPFSSSISSSIGAATAANAIVYATRIESVDWTFTGSKFSCQISHYIDDFGTAIFERQAGLTTRFILQSQSPRMKTGKANLISQPPVWLNTATPKKLALVDVRHGETPIIIQRKISERMLAELQKGMNLHLVRQPWYGDKQALQVIVPSIAFQQSYSDYLACLGHLLPVNFSQVEKKSLYYNNHDEDLSTKTKSYLQKVATYLKEDASVKAVYIDAHTDSTGIRNENLIKSKERAQKVVDYLIANGITKELIITRWHGERYQVATNKTKAGKAKNRRVTIRLSKDEPNKALTAMKQETQGEEKTDMADQPQATKSQ